LWLRRARVRAPSVTINRESVGTGEEALKRKGRI